MKKTALGLTLLISLNYFDAKSQFNYDSLLLKNRGPLNEDVNYVPDKKTAIKIAKAVWLTIYGKSINRRKPYTAYLNRDSVWVVKGHLKISHGGVPYAFIQKKDGKIIYIIHTK